MYEWHVAIGIESPPYRLDFYVLAEDASDAKQEALRKVPRGDRVTKIILVERRY